jgi:hypothetical protein
MQLNRLAHSAIKAMLSSFSFFYSFANTYRLLFCRIHDSFSHFFAASFAAGNVFFEIVFSSISFHSAPVFAYFVLASLTFALGTITIIINIIIPVVVQYVHAVGSAKSTLMLKMKPLVEVSHICSMFHTLFWVLSLFLWGPMKFPPFSWMTYTLPSLALLLIAQQLRDIRQICFKCDASCGVAFEQQLL